jgi:hypothetical protein
MGQSLDMTGEKFSIMLKRTFFAGHLGNNLDDTSHPLLLAPRHRSQDHLHKLN